MRIRIQTTKKQEIVDITDKVRKIVKDSSITQGIAFIYARHATGAVIINENADPNLHDDILGALNNIIPDHAGYKHDLIDNNAGAHIKSVILGSGKFIPIEQGELMLGIWQNIFFVELDSPRKREIIVSIIINK